MEETIKIPCTCSCHTNPNMVHMTACCNNGYIELPKIDKESAENYSKWRKEQDKKFLYGNSKV